MSKIQYLILIIILVIFASQPLITSSFISDSSISNLILVLGYLAIVYPSYLVYQLLAERLRVDVNKASKWNLELEKELLRIHNSTKNDFIFYKHFENEAFSSISKSVNEILGVGQDEFKRTYKRLKADKLFNGVFERNKTAKKNGIRVPAYEIEIQTKSGNTLLFEVTETPIYDSEDALLFIWGSLKKIELQIVNTDNDSCVDLNKFNILYNNVNDGVLLIQGDRFVECNQKALDIFQSSLDQLLMYSPFSNKYSPLVQPNGKNSKDEALRRIKLAYEGVTQKFEWAHIRHSGEFFRARVKLMRYEYFGHMYLIVVLKDISSSMDLLDSIDEKNRLINSIFVHSSNSILKIDSSYRVIQFNEKFRQIFKQSDELLYQDLSKMLQTPQINDWLDLLKKESFIEKEIELYNAVVGKKVRVKLKLMAVTERQKFAGALIIIEEINNLSELKSNLETQVYNFNEVISKSKDVLYKYDLIQKKYIYMSNSIEELLGYTSVELSAMTEQELKSLLHPSELDRAHLILAKLLDFNKEIEDQQQEFKIIDKSGLVKWVRDSYSVIYNNDKPIAIIGIMSDLTKQKEKDEYIIQKENLLNIMTENIAQGITVIVNNKIELVNSKLLEISGYSKQELNQIESLFIFAEEKEKVRLKEDYIKVISGSQEVNELSYWLKKKTGENIYITNHYYLDPKNPQNRYILTKDVTHVKIREYKANPTEKLKKELEYFLGNIPD